MNVHVDLGSRSYKIVVEESYERLGGLLRARLSPASRSRVAIVTERVIDDHVGALVGEALDDAGLAHATFTIAGGEDAKSLTTVERLCRDFTRFGLLRGDVVVAMGGGVVGDVAGFTAAVYYRGIDVVQVPTTLLAMVDSAIGGKTGVNLPEGKNLVGAFHQPIGVFANPRVLATLPDRDYRCGLGEVAKYALMGDDFVSARVEPLLERDPATLADVIARCAALKARCVEADELERTGVRAVLNYGHTLGHALETASGHSLQHGEAVAIGLVFAAHLATALERTPPGLATHTESLVGSLGLPVQAPGGLTADELLTIMKRDKKSAGGLTFVLDGPSGIERVDDPDPVAVTKALAAIGVEV
jgi:5-deoxy-5-amino-3-dehydroquinate synthase